MADSITTGLLAVSVAPIANDGGPGTVFATIGYTDRDQETSFTQADPTTTEKYANETDTPLYTIVTQGLKTLQMSLVAQNVDQLVQWLGGTKSGAGTGPSPYTWVAPDAIPNIENTVKLTPRSGKVFQFNRVKWTAKPDFQMGPDGWFTLNLTGQILQPLKAGVPVMTIKDAEPTA